MTANSFSISPPATEIDATNATATREKVMLKCHIQSTTPLSRFTFANQHQRTHALIKIHTLAAFGQEDHKVEDFSNTWHSLASSPAGTIFWLSAQNQAGQFLRYGLIGFSDLSKEMP